MAKEVDHLVSRNRAPRFDRILENAAELAESGQPKAPPTTVVWAEVPGDAKPAAPSSEWWAPLAKGLKLIWSGEREESSALPLQTVAGQIVRADSVAAGVPGLPLDPDGVVRKYRRRFEVIELSEEHPPSMLPERKEMNSLPHALASACQPCIARNRAWLEEEKDHSSSDLILRFFTDEHVFNPMEAKYLLPPLPSDSLYRPTQAEIDQTLAARPLQIVLIGGTYKGARDLYRTPLGEMPGVQLLAQAVETDLHQGISEMGELGKFSADILAGLAVVFLWNCKAISRHVPLRFIFLLSLVGIFFAFTVISHYLFRYGIWLDSIAILVGVVIHQVYEEFDKIKELKLEVAERDCIIAELTKQPDESCPPDSQAPSSSGVSASKSQERRE